MFYRAAFTFNIYIMDVGVVRNLEVCVFRTSTIVTRTIKYDIRERRPLTVRDRGYTRKTYNEPCAIHACNDHMISLSMLSAHFTGTYNTGDIVLDIRFLYQYLRFYSRTENALCYASECFFFFFERRGFLDSNGDFMDAI